ncbi:MAG: hypothetical protein AAGD96_11860 [Chloroflexota bacterium]
MKRSQNHLFAKTTLYIFIFGTLLLFAVSPELSQAKLGNQGQTTNLISNGNFESGNNSWAICGGGEVITKGNPAVLDKNIHQGESSLRLGNPTGTRCTNEIFGPYQMAYQQIAIPADVEALTVSFWYTRRGTFFDGGSTFEYSGDLNIGLATEPLEGLTSFPVWISVEEITPFDQRGWHLFRQSLDADDLAELRSGLGQNSTVYLTIQMSGVHEDPVFQNGEQIAYYIDSVEVVMENVTTQSAPLPADLANITDQPIVLTKYDPNHPSPVNDNSFSVFRVNPDGSNAVPIYPGLLASPIFPTWSNDGTKIAAVDNTVSDPLNIFSSGNISAFSTFNPDGNNLTEVFRTFGGGGNLDPSLPPEQQLPNIHSRITGVEWSPDSGQVVATVCFRSQGNVGFSDETCELQFRNSTSGDVESRINSGFRVDWNSNNQLLFGTTAFGELVPGIYEIDLNQNNGDSPTQLIRTWENEIPFHGDGSPSWAPNNETFAIVRDLPGTYRKGDGSLHGKQSIVLYDRTTLPAEQDDPEFILLVDHGELLGNLTWSPEGKYLLYTLFNKTADGTTTGDVWWLDVTTGETGNMTNDSVSLGASWRPAGSSIIAPPAILNQRTYLPLVIR